jgi:putative endonuclease
MQRVTEHWLSRGNTKTFTGRYQCYWLIYFEDFDYVDDAITREKEIKGWNREKKLALIKATNPTLKLLNFELFPTWPPENACHRKDLNR